ncbi:AGE family epimerase/isomerase [Massilia sp. LjRoot122]|uniref:AGE family epimerase/isomerase n=1 Tax=Massilia sp. LjRoot122 TaxID=3342257 RepID=UPI003ECEBB4B
MSTFPNFRSPTVLLDHARHTMRFYHPRAIDPAGGLFHFFKDDGTVYDTRQRHLVSSTRFVFTYAMAYRHFQDPAYLEGLRHALRFLRAGHRDPISGGYAWLLDGDKVADDTQHAYGLAFVLLAYAHATMAGLEQARVWIGESFELMEKRFWDPQAGLYADEASRDWTLSGYRGQNANMHACEALLAAYNATGERRYLERAYTVADNITRRQAERCGGLVWEHYDAQWQPDWVYNVDDPENLFRPWGYQPGHFTEWAKLLLQLEKRALGVLEQDLDWLLPTAERLFRVAVEKGWDAQYGGLCYSLAPDLSVCDAHKYFWVQAESAAAAAMLAQRTGNAEYWDWYQRLWEYSWTHMVDHEHGAWYRILDRQNRKLSDEKSPAGKVDYHTMGACYDIVAVLKEGGHD